MINNKPSNFDRLLTIVFAALLAIQILYLFVGVASIPVYYHRTVAGTIEPVVYNGVVQVSNELAAQNASDRGLSLEQYAVYRILFTALSALIPILIAALIVRRARWNWFAWFAAFVIVYLGVTNLFELMYVSKYISFGIAGFNDLFWFLVLPFIFLFPNGKAVPRRAAWVVGALVIYHFFIQVGTVFAYMAPDFAQRFNLPNWGMPEFIWPVLLNFAIILACQVYRFRRVLTPTERQQTKWFLFGFGILVMLIPVSVSLDSMGRSGFLRDIVAFLLWLPLYLGLAIAILRYRLWDIDLIIRRTLVYAALSLTLGLVYFGSVLVLQNLVQGLPGQEESPLVIVISTLLIAALFNPLRRRIQNDIDRRFFRRRYNAEQTLEAFAADLRQEVDLEAISQSLLAATAESMQPESASLWVSDIKRSGRR